MTTDTPIRNADDMTTVYATNTIPFDAPVYDDLDGVIDDSDSHYKSGISLEDIVLEELAREQKLKQKAIKTLKQELKELLRTAKYETESQTPTLDKK